LTIQDLEDMGGNIISLQKDPTGNIVSLVSGTWQFNKSAVLRAEAMRQPSNSDLISQPIKWMEFQLTASRYQIYIAQSTFTDKIAVLDGTVSLKGKDKVADDEIRASNVVIPCT
jgi:hypothetical protein